MKKEMIFLGLLMSVSACSSIQNTAYYHDRENEYQQAKSAPSLTVPRDLSDAKLSSAYNIPPRDGKLGVDIHPPIE